MNITLICSANKDNNNILGVFWSNKPLRTIRTPPLYRFLETKFIIANWIERCPHIGPHLYIYMVFKELSLNESDIRRLTSKPFKSCECWVFWGVRRRREEKEVRSEGGDGNKLYMSVN